MILLQTDIKSVVLIQMWDRFWVQSKTGSLSQSMVWFILNFEIRKVTAWKAIPFQWVSSNPAGPAPPTNSLFFQVFLPSPSDHHDWICLHYLAVSAFQIFITSCFDNSISVSVLFSIFVLYFLIFLPIVHTLLFIKSLVFNNSWVPNRTMPFGSANSWLKHLSILQSVNP